MNVVNKLEESERGNLRRNHHYGKDELKGKVLALEMIHVNAVCGHCGEVRREHCGHNGHVHAVDKRAEHGNVVIRKQLLHIRNKMRTRYCGKSFENLRMYPR